MLRNKSSRIRLHASDHWDASSSAIDTSKASVAIHRRDCDICAQKRSWALQALTHTSVWNLTFYALVLRYSLTTFYNALVNDWSQIQIITSCCYLLFWWFDDHEPWFQGRDSGFQYNYFLAACGHNSYKMRQAECRSYWRLSCKPHRSAQAASYLGSQPLCRASFGEK